MTVQFLILKRSTSIKIAQASPTCYEGSDPLPNEISDFDTIREAFIEYVNRESTILQLDDFSKDEYGGRYIGYDCGYKTEERRDIFLSAGLAFDNGNISNGIIAASLVIRSTSEYFESHYKKLESCKTEIEKTFSLENIKFKKVGGTHRLSMEKFHVDLSLRENWDTEFQWLRENLERLFWVLRLHDTIQITEVPSLIQTQS